MGYMSVVLSVLDQCSFQQKKKRRGAGDAVRCVIKVISLKIDMADQKTKVLVAGSDGMLGSMVTKVLSADPDLEVTALGRGDFDARVPQILPKADWVVNCVGIIKPRLTSVTEAMQVNSMFPYALAELGIPVINITTDCVFSGLQPIYDSYIETSPHDAHDVYGKTKSLGEVYRENFYNIRTSIVGPQEGNPSLLQWFLDLPHGAKIKGFHGHQWNGITTLAFAKICQGIIKGNKPEVTNFHLVPNNSFTKYQLLHVFSETFNRPDIKIEVDNDNYCNRRLGTLYPENNEMVWKQAGYSQVPTIQQLLKEIWKN